MFCNYCGKELPDGAKFCRFCGEHLAEEDAAGAGTPNTTAAAATSGTPAASAPATQAAPSAAASATQAAPAVTGAAPATASANPAPAVAGAATAATPAPKKKMKTSTKVIIIASISAVVVIAVLCALYNAGSKYIALENMVEDSVCKSSSFYNGFVGDDYTNGSSYTLTKFEITDHTTVNEPLKLAWYGGQEVEKVNFKGKIKNDSFESEFTGEGYFTWDNDGWKQAGAPVKKTSSTKPVKGIDTFDKTTSSSSSSSSSSYTGTKTVDNFKSELAESNGTYYCEASQDYKIEYWFGTDTASVKQQFRFNPEKGWEKQGDQEISNQKTEYSLAGKSFECITETYSAKDTLTLTFKDSSETPSADYTIHHPDTSSANRNTRPVDLSGTATGQIKHTFGENKFIIELKDESQQVAFRGNSSSAKEVEGVGKLNTMYLSVTTNANYYESGSYSSKYSTSGTFVETNKPAT